MATIPDFQKLNVLLQQLRRDGYLQLQFVPFRKHSDEFVSAHLGDLLVEETKLLDATTAKFPVLYCYSLCPAFFARRIALSSKQQMLADVFLCNRKVSLNRLYQELPDYVGWVECSAAHRENVRFAYRVVPAYNDLILADPIDSDQDDYVFLHNDSLQMAKYLRESDICRGKTVADVGTGSGILAVTAAHLQATRVIAVDINPRAVDFARITFDSNDLPSIEARLGSIAEVIDDVDLVISNPPYMIGRTPISLNGGGEDGLDVPREFIRRAAEARKDLVMILERNALEDHGSFVKRLEGKLTAHKPLRRLGSRELAVYEFRASGS